MYIEKLNYSNFEHLASYLGCEIEKIADTDENEIYLDCFVGNDFPNLQVWLSDFNLTASLKYNVAETELKRKYITFMANLFGAEYVDDYGKFCAEEIQNEKNDRGLGNFLQSFTDVKNISLIEKSY